MGLVTSSSLTIAHLDAETGFSGGEVQAFLLMEGLRRRGHRNVLICPPGSRSEARAAELGIETRTVPMANDFDLAAVFRLRRELVRSGANLVHLHTGRATWLGGLAAWRAGLPAVTTRRMDRNVKRGWRTGLIYRSLVRRAVAISPSVADSLARGGVPEGRTVLISSAVDPEALRPAVPREVTRRELGVAQDEVVLLTLSSLVPRKGVDVLLDALATLDEGDRAPRPMLWVAGDGPERAALEERAERLGLQRGVRFLGRRDDAPDLLAACDVFVLPSRREGLGVAALEAMAVGRPVVASNVGGLGEAVVDERTGLLVPPDDAQALAQAVRRVTSESALRERLAEAGPARIGEGFLAGQMVEAYECLYRDVLAEEGDA